MKNPNLGPKVFISHRENDCFYNHEKKRKTRKVLCHTEKNIETHFHSFTLCEHFYEHRKQLLFLTSYFLTQHAHCERFHFFPNFFSCLVTDAFSRRNCSFSDLFSCVFSANARSLSARACTFSPAPALPHETIP